VNFAPKSQPNNSEDLAANDNSTLDIPRQVSSSRSLDFEMTILLLSVIALALLLGAFIGNRQEALMHHVKSRHALLASRLANGSRVQNQLSSASAADCSQIADTKSVSKTAALESGRHSGTTPPGGLMIYRNRQLIFQQSSSQAADSPQHP
jgi:hypothetical protein